MKLQSATSWADGAISREMMNAMSRLASFVVAVCLAGTCGWSITRAHAQDAPLQAIVDAVVESVCQKRLVMLGELPSHGEARTFEAKAGIVDALRARCGFTAVLFEAPVYDFVGLERAVAAGTAVPGQFDNAAGRFWWTRELTPWRRSLFAAAADRRVALGGLDDQLSVTGLFARATLPSLVASAVPAARAALCADTVSRHVGWTYDTEHPFDPPEQGRLAQCATEAAAASRRPTADAGDRAMLESFARYAARQRSGTGVGRDESMFRTLAWYVDRLPPEARVVVWTATVHAARQRGTRPEPTLAERAVERWGTRVATVGFTAFEGYTSMAGRAPTPLPSAPPGSLEATATGTQPWAFLTSDQLRRLGSVPSRLLGRFTAANWADCFDAVVVIRREVAPTFDPWKPGGSGASRSAHQASGPAFPARWR